METGEDSSPRSYKSFIPSETLGQFGAILDKRRKKMEEKKYLIQLVAMKGASADLSGKISDLLLKRDKTVTVKFTSEGFVFEYEKDGIPEPLGTVPYGHGDKVEEETINEHPNVGRTILGKNDSVEDGPIFRIQFSDEYRTTEAFLDLKRKVCFLQHEQRKYRRQIKYWWCQCQQ